MFRQSQRSVLESALFLPFGSRLILAHPFRDLISAALMQSYLISFARSVVGKFKLRVNNFKKEQRGTFGEKREFTLTGQLGQKFPIFHEYRQLNARCKRVRSDNCVDLLLGK